MFFVFFFNLEMGFLEGKKEGLRPNPESRGKEDQLPSGSNITDQLQPTTHAYLLPCDAPHWWVTLRSLPGTGHKDFYQHSLLHITQICDRKRIKNHRLAILHLHIPSPGHFCCFFQVRQK